MVDLLSRRGEDPPGAAELVDGLAGDLARLPVADEVVERMARVGDLELSVTAPGRPEQRRLDAGARKRLALREERRPQRGAGAVADARRAPVGREVVER